MDPDKISSLSIQSQQNPRNPRSFLCHLLPTRKEEVKVKVDNQEEEVELGQVAMLKMTHFETLVASTRSL